MRVFLDANILFSAAADTSATRRLLFSASGYAELVSNAYAWEESLRNLQRKRPQHVDGLESLRKVVRTTNAHVLRLTGDIPDDDLPILAGAVASGCTHLWTGDRRHFGAWYGRELHGVTVVSSIMLADLLFEQGWKPQEGME